MERPTNSDDLIDSRDVIAAIEELEELDEAQATFECDVCGRVGNSEDGCATDEDCPDLECTGTCRKITSGLDEDEAAELAALRTLADEAEGYAGDWRYGETLIRDSYFEDYARDFANDIGAISDDARWPATCIDWEQAARELQMDYTAVEFDGVTYWIR